MAMWFSAVMAIPQNGIEWGFEERGLKNIPTTADALPALLDPAVETLFASTGVLTPKELKSRYEVYSEQYILAIEVEAKLVIEMATTGIYPAALSYLIENTDAMAAAAAMNITFENTVAEKIADATNKMMATVEKLRSAIEKHDFSSTEEHMKYCATDIRSLMDETRVYADTLEGYIANKLWPYPKYSEMLFIK